MCVMETAVKELGVVCVGDCSERVRGVCETETAMKELGGGVYDGDCSES